jgi:hypothetical protein
MVKIPAKSTPDKSMPKISELTQRFPLPAVIFYLIATTPLGFAAGMYIGNKWLLPLISSLLFFPVFVIYLTAKRRRSVFFLSLFWIVMLSLMMILTTLQNPQQMEELTLGGTAYTEGMFNWIKTGEGAEGSPALFLPHHIINLLAFLVATALTGGFGGLLLGTILLNYMNFYVGMLALNGDNPALLALIGWSPWAVLRVVGFLLLAIALAEPFWNLLGRKKQVMNLRRPYLWSGLGLVVLDIVLKWLLAGSWRDLLLSHFKG